MPIEYRAEPDKHLLDITEETDLGTEGTDNSFDERNSREVDKKACTSIFFDEIRQGVYLI